MDFNNYTPLRDNLIIELTEKTSKSGLIMASTELDEVATVKAVGDEVKNVHVNDKVIYNQFAGTLLSKDDTHHRIVTEKDILVIVRG